MYTETKWKGENSYTIRYQIFQSALLEINNTGYKNSRDREFMKNQIGTAICSGFISTRPYN